MKITPIASEFIGILASVVKMYRGYIVYIAGGKYTIHVHVINVYGLGTTPVSGN